ncbi:DUF2306 domain-containing protein [Flavobacterium sangjuense]|uniref:DUF2306 domain-containing protein n=1 Tax=Flavobacterium sangjuense TaxID=2518177 RepID=A0A4P7PSM8_9FLAO|nr:DUF2306 domain-containing protein [Flavobacterium sangjuense]QBZ97565.1 hypothetical protein GS03_01057 [Flavobacterium sangjuense]
MTNKITFIIFWTLFIGSFLVFFFPTLSYISNGFPEFMSLNTTVKKAFFITHILSGIIVYITAFFQFAPFIRNKNIRLHRKLGKIHITVALICIISLYYIIYLGKNVGLPFWPSQYAATTLWLIFILLGVYFARQKRIVWHRRFMISGFICAAYFVTVRIIDRFFMGIFKSIFKDEVTSLLISDVFVWAFPLIICWCYWLLLLQRNPR